MAQLVNELVWSHSRARLFDDCLRAYWYSYYGSWGGWEAGAAPATRQAYVEKKLTRRPMWTGTVVHGIAEEALKRVRAGRPWTVTEAITAATTRARADIDGSLSGAWLSRPAKRVGFAEHYYRELVAPEAWDAAIAEIGRQVQGLFDHRIYRRLAQVPERILDIEELHRFPVGDAEVYVSLDVLVADGHGGVVIIDWKTGESHDDATIAAQLGVYGLFVTRELAIAEDRVKAMHVNLRHATERVHPVGPAEIDAARAEIGESIARMRGRLADVRANQARAEDHPVLPEDSPRCRFCNFRRSCGREG